MKKIILAILLGLSMLVSAQVPAQTKININTQTTGILNWSRLPTLTFSQLNNTTPSAGQLPYVPIGATSASQFAYLGVGTTGCYLFVSALGVPAWDNGLCYANGVWTLNGAITANTFQGNGPYNVTTTVGALVVATPTQSSFSINTDGNWYANNGSVGTTFYKVMTNGTGISTNSIHMAAQTGAISIATLCSNTVVSSVGSCDVAGQYHVHFDFIETGTACSSVAAGSVTFLLTWVDSGGITHSAVVVPMLNQTGATSVAVGNAFTFATAKANAGASGDFNISTNGSLIQYATGYIACTTGTGTYQLDAAVTRIQ